MKKFLCALLALLLLPVTLLAEPRQGASNKLTIQLLESLSNDVTADETCEILKAQGVKYRRGQRDMSVDITGGELDGVPLKRVTFTFTGEERRLLCAELHFALRASATYMKPGANFDALLALLTERYGEPSGLTRSATSVSRYWQNEKMTAELRYFDGRREQAKSLAVFWGFGPIEAEETQALQYPQPASFAWTNGIRMGMTRDEVSDIETGEPLKAKGDALMFRSKSLGEQADITYAFDADGKLCRIAASFSRKPWDPVDVIGTFTSMERMFKWELYGQPEREDAMIWRPGHTYDVLDGSKWLRALQQNTLVLENVWTVGGVRIELRLANVDEKLQPSIVCAPAQ